MLKNLPIMFKLCPIFFYLSSDSLSTNLYFKGNSKWLQHRPYKFLFAKIAFHRIDQYALLEQSAVSLLQTGLLECIDPILWFTIWMSKDLLPIYALYLMFSGIYYAQNYASIIGEPLGPILFCVLLWCTHTCTNTHTYKERITSPGIPIVLALLRWLPLLPLGPCSVQFPGQAHTLVKLNVYNKAKQIILKSS